MIEVVLSRPAAISVGRRGRILFQAGRYLYVGSAARGLAARVARHARRDKTRRWHIDYLTSRTPARRVWVWQYQSGLECEIARDLARVGAVVDGFGASDCHCAGHLFHLGKLRGEGLPAEIGRPCWQGWLGRARGLLVPEERCGLVWR